MTSLYGDGIWGAGKYSGSLTYKDLGSGSMSIAVSVFPSNFSRIRDFSGGLNVMSAFNGTFTAVIDMTSGTIASIVDFAAAIGDLDFGPIWRETAPCPSNVWVNDPDLQDERDK